MEEPGSTIGAVSFAVLILIHAIISAAHASIVNARKQNLRDLADEGNKRAQRVLKLAEDSTRLLASRQFFSIMLHFLAAGVLTLFIDAPLIQTLVLNGTNVNVAQTIVYGISWLLGALLMMLFGELIPAAIASDRADAFSMMLIDPMRLLLGIISPVSRFLIWVSNKVVMPFDKDKKMPYVTEEEIKTLIDAGSEGGGIETEEKEMIYSIFQFGDKVVREVMTPRIDIISLEAQTTLPKALDMVLAKGHSRIPVYEESIDRVLGLLYAKDLLKAWRDGKLNMGVVRDIIRPAYFVPESKKAGSLLEELQERKIHMAIVIDEYGGTAGLVTIEDLLEEIVGEIQDEYDPDEEAEYEKITDDEYVFDASIHLFDVNELLDAELPTEESDTLGGYVFSFLGKVPLEGETFREGDLEIRVESITGRRIRKVRVTRIAPVMVELATAAHPSNGDPEAKTDAKAKVETGEIKIEPKTDTKAESPVNETEKPPVPTVEDRG